jgi:dTDP-4-dehydrorhamnose reductase
MESKKCIVGSTGFVGSTLKRQTDFNAGFSSANIEQIQHGRWDTVVCAAAPAQKWLANLDPEKDLENLQKLWMNVQSVQAKRFILVSTVDVFEKPVGVVEESSVGHDSAAYGRNRKWLEDQARQRFENHLIVRLPGLVGSGLRKNIIFDFKNNNNLDRIESRSVFQFYPMENLWNDIERVSREGLKLIHLTAAPIEVSRVAELAGFSNFRNEISSTPATYDFRTSHANLWGTSGNYQYSLSDTEVAIERYLSNEDSDE